jgi:DNA-binding MarR family transcriptional regulator
VPWRIGARLHRLAEAGLVERRPDPVDGRGLRVRLTTKGRNLEQ